MENRTLTHNRGRFRGAGQPPHLPNLIVAGNSSLIKLSGHPYASPLSEKGEWPILASSTLNPLLLVLEHIWTRLSYQHHVGDVFGDDLHAEVFAPLLSAKPMRRPTNPSLWGWQYIVHKIPTKFLRTVQAEVAWKPTEISVMQNAVFMRLCREDIEIDEPELAVFLKKEGVDVAEFIKSLTDTRLVAVDQGKLTLITSQCMTAVLPDGRFVAADNNTGRLTRWLAHYMDDYKKANSAI